MYLNDTSTRYTWHNPILSYEGGVSLGTLTLPLKLCIQPDALTCEV